jgi:hypothetical protein
MSDEDWAQTALKQYQRVPALVRDPYDADTGLQVLNHLLDREQLAADAGLQRELQQADRAVGEALAEADPSWLRRLREEARVCGFSSSEWWMGVLRQAQSLQIATERT